MCKALQLHSPSSLFGCKEELAVGGMGILFWEIKEQLQMEVISGIPPEDNR